MYVPFGHGRLPHVMKNTEKLEPMQPTRLPVWADSFVDL